MVNIPTHRPPTHPGELLLNEFLEPMKITQSKLAKDIGVPFQRINELVNGKRGITSSTALRLGKYFGTTSQYWMNMQLAWDLYHTQVKEKDAIDAIVPPINP